jgi:hypothetical protein
MLKTYNAVNGQSIYDVCLNAYGSLDNLVKLLTDSGAGQGVNDVPASRQAYIFDDSLVIDQSINQAYTLSGIRYATLLGTNGQTYYVIIQKRPKPITGEQPTVIPPVNPDDMITQVASTEFVSGANGTTVITPLDKDGNSMIGYDLVQLEKEIRPISKNNWVWNKTSGILTLTNSEVVDTGETLFILYSKIV